MYKKIEINATEAIAIIEMPNWTTLIEGTFGRFPSGLYWNSFNGELIDAREEKILYHFSITLDAFEQLDQKEQQALKLPKRPKRGEKGYRWGQNYGYGRR